MSKILDVCCGSKMFWFDKNNKNVVFMDIRELDDILIDFSEETGIGSKGYDELSKGFYDAYDVWEVADQEED